MRPYAPVLLSLLILFMGMMSGCHHRYDPRLLAVEELMRVDRDSAIAMLTRFEERGDTSHLSEPDSHLYQLLRAQSRYYTDIIDTVNPVLEAAGDYFERNKEWRRAGESRLQLGVLCRNRSAYMDAIVQTMWAENYYKQANDSINMARSNHQIGRLYDDMNDLATAEKYYNIAKSIYEHTGDKKNYPWVLEVLAYNKSQQEKYEEALLLARRIVEIGKEYRDTQLMAAGYHNLLENSMGKEEFGAGKLYFDSLKNLGQQYVRDADIENLGLAYLGAGDCKAAEECLNSIKGDEISGELGLQLSLLKDDYENAYERLMMMSAYQSDEVLRYWQRDVANITEGYYSLKLLHQQEEIRLRKTFEYVGIIFIGAFIMTILIIFYRKYNTYKKIKSKDEEEKRMLNSMIDEWIDKFNASQDAKDKLQGRMRALNDEIVNMDLELSTIRESQNALNIKEQDLEKREKYLLERELYALDREKNINRKEMEVREIELKWEEKTKERLRQEKLEHHATMKDTTRILHSELISFLQELNAPSRHTRSLTTEKIHELFLQSLTSKKTLARLVSIANLRYDNIITHFNADLTDISESYKQMFLYYVLQFPTYVIGILMGDIAPSVIKTRKARLREKIKKSGLEKTNEYLFFLI